MNSLSTRLSSRILTHVLQFRVRTPCWQTCCQRSSCRQTRCRRTYCRRPSRLVYSCMYASACEHWHMLVYTLERKTKHVCQHISRTYCRQTRCRQTNCQQVCCRWTSRFVYLLTITYMYKFDVCPCQFRARTHCPPLSRRRTYRLVYRCLLACIHMNWFDIRLYSFDLRTRHWRHPCRRTRCRRTRCRRVSLIVCWRQPYI